MRLTPSPAEVRELVANAFEDLGVAIFDSSGLKETIVIDDGRYVARSYRADGYMAMWLIGVGIVQLYDDEGNMLRTINLLLELKLQRMVA
jgi:hypothetical protein